MNTYLYLIYILNLPRYPLSVSILSRRLEKAVKSKVSAEFEFRVEQVG